MGKTDRVLRGIAGLIIILAGVYFQSWWGAIGLIPLTTAFISFCPLYVPFKISTKKTES